MAAWFRREKDEVCIVPDESVVEEGLGSFRISRRGLIKAGAIVGGTVWVAPVIDSFVSRATAASEAHYCCCCTDPTNGTAQPYQCESDGIPTSVSACISYCKSINGTNGSAAGYQKYQWCGPAPTGWNTSSGACIGASTKSCQTGSIT
jgi:hypothetical protein